MSLHVDGKTPVWYTYILFAMTIVVKVPNHLSVNAVCWSMLYKISPLGVHIQNMGPLRSKKGDKQLSRAVGSESVGRSEVPYR
jgi:hypothetical protein